MDEIYWNRCENYKAEYLVSWGSPITRMLLSCSTPSILDRSWLTTVSCTPVLLAPVPLCLQIASSSSKIMMWRPLFAPSWKYKWLRFTLEKVEEELKTPQKSHPFLFLFCLCKQFADVGFRFSHILVKDLWAIYNLWLSSIEHLANLPSHQCFPTSRWSKQQDPFHVLTAWSPTDTNTDKKKGETVSTNLFTW